jgi:hypothetical protein
VFLQITFISKNCDIAVKISGLYSHTGNSTVIYKLILKSRQFLKGIKSLGLLEFFDCSVCTFSTYTAVKKFWQPQRFNAL